MGRCQRACCGRHSLTAASSPLPRSFERLEECAYLNASIKEVLRLYPPAPLHVRVADRDATLPMEDGRQLRVEEGTVLWFPNYYAHRDPKYWSDPEAFIPERFMADRPGGPEPSHPYAYRRALMRRGEQLQVGPGCSP